MYQLKAEGQSICKIVNSLVSYSLVSNFASVLFDFALRVRLANNADVKLLTSELLVDYFTDKPSFSFFDIQLFFKRNS